jgi:hypothetical protein
MEWVVRNWEDDPSVSKLRNILRATQARFIEEEEEAAARHREEERQEALRVAEANLPTEDEYPETQEPFGTVGLGRVQEEPVQEPFGEESEDDFDISDYEDEMDYDDGDD